VTAPAEALADALATGAAALERGAHDAAVVAFGAARSLAPRDVALALALADTHRLRGAADAERVLLGDAFATTDWGAPPAAQSLGAALLRVGLADAAATCFEHVLACRPDEPAALAALASARRQQGRPADAWPLAQRALRGAPRDPVVLLTAAQVRHDLADPRGARTWLDRAERARPGHAGTALQRAYSSLIDGATPEAWADFEARARPIPPDGVAAWHGEPLAGATLLVDAEQGVGDQLQFVRFVGTLDARGAGRVIVTCHPSLLTLFRASGLDAVPRGEAPAADRHVPLLSLPHRLGLGGDVLGTRVPYLQLPTTGPAGDPELPPARTDGVPRLGLVWAGNPDFPGRGLRDLDQETLAAVVASARVDWISLQQGPAGDHTPPHVHRLPPLGNWAATARLLQQLDGLVTTDTGIAHLAGALGLRTWVLLQHVPDWRWGLHGDSTPWYPSLTLMRQSAPRDWASAVSALATRLAAAFPGAAR
jgi:tetratricopeptide (TPR) repeat protein